jgi:hypothetical protein
MAAGDEEPAGEVVGEPRVAADVDLDPADGVRVCARVVELVLLRRQQQPRPGAEVERDGALLAEGGVPRDRLGEELVDPRSGLREEEAAVAPGGAGADPAAVEKDDVGPGRRESARRGAAGNAGSDDGDVRGS